MASAKLVSVSQPSAYPDCKTPQELVAWAARVSNPGNQNNTKTAPKLIKYLIKNEHWSPLEMVSVSIEIRTTRDIARQILRHRSFSFQEFSQRYADPTATLGFELREARLQDKKNRQNSIHTEDTLLTKGWNTMQQQVIAAVKNAYGWAAQNGIAKEQARAVLPEGNMESVVIMAGTLRSWVHYCQLRMAHGTQKEHMEVAQLCWNIISEQFPDVKTAIDEINREKQIKQEVYEIVMQAFMNNNEEDLADELVDSLTEYFTPREVFDDSSN